MKMDGRESPEMKTRKAAEETIDKTTVPLSKAPASPLKPPSSPEKADVRPFALVKKLYESSGTSSERSSRCDSAARSKT